MSTPQESPNTGISLAIIIPYYQKQRGILKRCINSIVQQQCSDNFQVIIVDDGSPVSAKSEIESVFCPNSEVRIINQPNSGAGAARNTGLDNVPSGTKYVAFLDSDDEWSTDYLSNAVFGLEKGYDLFIGNTQRFGKKGSRFEWNTSLGLNINPLEHLLIDADRQLYEFEGDFFDLLVQRSSIISTSAMVYRYEKYSSIRFNTKLFNGQDRLFKLALKDATYNAIFTPSICAYEGEGINIFDRSQWGAERSLSFLSSYIQLPKAILDEIDLTPDQRQYILSQLRESRYSFAASLLHLLRAGKRIDSKVIMKTFRNDPKTLLLLFPNSAKVIFRKASPAD